MSKTARDVIFDELTSSPSDVMDLADDIIHALNTAGFVIVPKDAVERAVAVLYLTECKSDGEIAAAFEAALAPETPG